MSKLMMFFCIFLLAMSAIMAAPERCGRHGDSCVASSDCCKNLLCHRFANRCQVQITEDELKAQYEKIMGRKGKVY